MIYTIFIKISLVKTKHKLFLRLSLSNYAQKNFFNQAETSFEILFSYFYNFL